MRRLSFKRLIPPHQPLVFVALAFIGGLVFAAHYPATVRIWFLVAAVWWLAAAVCMFFRQSAAIVLLLGGCFATGGLLWAVNEASAGKDSVRRLFEVGELKPDEPVEIIGKLNTEPELAPERMYLSIKVEQLKTLGRERSASGLVRMVVPLKDEESRQDFDRLSLDYGKRVRVLGDLSNKRGYKNPGAPDFDEMLEASGYTAYGVVKSPLLIETIGNGKRNEFLAWLYSLRGRAIATTLRSFKQPASGTLVAALFGNRHFLERDTAEVFRNGGTFHLLVISGLHVAMIAVFALWLAGLLFRPRSMQYLLVISVMWAYALMIGAGAAVTRAVVMLTIALIGQLIYRSSIGPNTLAASAIVLLLWQPRDLFNSGFQLSFLTALIIVAVVTPVYQRMKKIGEWQPTAKTPYPPRTLKAVKWLAEVMFWNEREFKQEMLKAHIRFQLQKSATARWLSRWRLQRPLAWIVATLFTTTAIQIGLLPLMIVLFHRFSIVSPISNIIESALVFLLMLSGAFYLIAFAAAGSLVAKLSGLVNAIGWLTVKSGEPLLAWRKSSFRVPDWGESSAVVFTAYFSAVLILIVLINEWNPFRKGDEPEAMRRKLIGRSAAIVSLSLLIILSVLLILHPFAPSFQSGRLEVTFLDVGQGDAMLIVFPRGSTMLLDSGGRIAFDSPEMGEESQDFFVEDRLGIAEAAVMPFLWRRGIKRLDWIAASHGDADHAEGFAEITRSFEIHQAVKAVASRRGLFDLFEQAVGRAGLSLWCIKRTDRFEIDGVLIEAISPFGNQESLAMSDNDQSLALRLTFGQRRFLLTGDIEKEAEEILVNAESDLRADVLKVAHHGSRTSTTEGFLQRVKPRHAVISAAEPNPYGHPHIDVVQRLQASRARIWRTSRCGAITISTDGDDLQVNTFIKCESDGQSAGNVSRSSPER
ncbi:MAG: ComEC/Rec2 family competence protein [Blastocatellales bacterium]